MDLAAERVALLARDAQWAAAASAASDIDAIVSYWTDDAVVLPAGMPAVTGKAAIRAYVEASLATPGFTINWQSTDVTVSADGTLAHLIGTNRVTVNGEDGSPMTFDGRVVTIWRRDDDNQWRCAVDIWNSAS